jgi:hypothetical protein
MVSLAEELEHPSLAPDLRRYQENIDQKLNRLFKPGEESTASRLSGLAERVSAKLQTSASDDPDAVSPIQKVELVSLPSFQERLRNTSGPYLEFLGVGSFVLPGQSSPDRTAKVTK